MPVRGGHADPCRRRATGRKKRKEQHARPRSPGNDCTIGAGLHLGRACRAQHHAAHVVPDKSGKNHGGSFALAGIHGWMGHGHKPDASSAPRPLYRLPPAPLTKRVITSSGPFRILAALDDEVGQSHLNMETCASRPNPETQGQDGTPDVPSFPRKREPRPLCSQRDARLARSARQSGCALVWSRAGPFNDRVESLLNVTCNRPGRRGCCIAQRCALPYPPRILSTVFQTGHEQTGIE
jgi:hypothetical protein